MSKLQFIIFICLQLKIFIISADNTFQVLSDIGEKGASFTSFTNNLFFLSSTKVYNIINENFHLIRDNKNNSDTQSPFFKNFEMVEASINKNTNESDILIAESWDNKINLYSFNLSAPLIQNNNPKLLDCINSSVDNSKISLIKVANDKYFLSYFLKGNKIENKLFKYASYEGYSVIKTYEHNVVNNGNNYISCFLLYGQIPVCYYTEKTITTISGSEIIKYKQKIMAFDIVVDRTLSKISYAVLSEDNDEPKFNKAIYLSNDYAVFCYIKATGELFYVVVKIEIDHYDFFTFTISVSVPSGLSGSITNCLNDAYKFDLIKIDEENFLIGCVKNDNNKIIFDFVTVRDSNSDNIFDTLDKQNFEISQKVETTLTFFAYVLNDGYKNQYGIIFDDSNDNKKLKYGYLNLPICTQNSHTILSLNFETTTDNTFKLSDYLDITLPIYPSSSSINKYKIISFISNDNDKNVFNYKILSSLNNEININDVVNKDDSLKISPLITNEFSSGKFFIEVAPLDSGETILGKSCKFEFDATCYEGCSSCNKYENTATEISKHNCLSCKSNYYSLNDLCLTECSLIKGYHDVYQTKTCLYEELEFVNDCSYKIWYIDQTKNINQCSYSSFCPSTLPYVYKSTGECIKFCRYSELIYGDCYISNIPGGGEESYNNIKSQIFSLGNNIFEKEDLNIVIYGTNITIEISDSLRILNKVNYKDFISGFNFTDCQIRLGDTIADPEQLILIKFDLRRNDTIAAQTEYELYYGNPPTGPLDLSSCKNAIIENPIFVDNSYKEKIKEIYSEGYDIFIIEEKFYSDLCVPYYDKDFDADLTLGKRQQVYYYMNANLCEKNCEYLGFDINKYKAICDCPIKSSINLDITRENVFDYIEESKQKLYYEETISNFKVLKCFKYIFSKKGFSYNWGSYFIMLILIGTIILTILWFKIGEGLILSYIREILDIIIIGLESEHQVKVKNKFEEIRENNKKPEQNGIENISCPPKKTEEDEINNLKTINNKDIISSENELIEKEKEIFRKKGPKKNEILLRSISIKKENLLKRKILIEQKRKINYRLEDIEKDLLSYEKAKIIDEREFSGYYWSLIKLRQLIIFTFFSFNDFNFFIIKLIAFLLLLSLNLAYNAIFFFDKIIDKIYDNKGKYSLKTQILNILICSLIFSFTIILVRFIITCHKKYIKLKEYENLEEAKKESYSIHKSLIIRYIIFIIVGIILLLFCWYFIHSFCAIFQCTQNHLFLNAFLSFILSMIYSFIYCLIPASFRYLGLKKNKKCFYCLSQYI